MAMKTALSSKSNRRCRPGLLDQKMEAIARADSSLIAQILDEGSEGKRGFACDFLIEKEFEDESEARITVVTRTQGKRIDLLSETMLCLAAQTDRRFRIVLVEHKVERADKDRIRFLVDNLPTWVQDRITIASTNSGGRSHPLNVGFFIADTDYAVILDDDDLVFDNWIETFIHGIEMHCGQIIHSGTYTQEWEKGHASCGDYYRAVEAPLPGYCCSFDFLEQMNCNYCPTMGLAYPLFPFRQFGVSFDESLDTVEDWDFLLRTSRFCGVHDMAENTAIYRLWSNGENSHSLHDEKEWEKNRQLVQAKLDSLPLIFPAGYFSEIAGGFDVSQDVKFNSDEVLVHVTRQNGNRLEVDSVKRRYSIAEQVNYIDIDVSGEEIRGLDIDLRTKGQMTLSDLELRVRRCDGAVLSFDMYDLCGNYYCYGKNKMAFISSYPHLKLILPFSQRIASCQLAFKYRNYVEEDLLTGTRLMLRVKRKVRRICKKMQRRIG